MKKLTKKGLPEIKRIDRKQWRFKFANESKKIAKEIAQDYKQRYGWYTRIVKGNFEHKGKLYKGYGVYIRKTK